MVPKCLVIPRTDTTAGPALSPLGKGVAAPSPALSLPRSSPCWLSKSPPLALAKLGTLL